MVTIEGVIQNRILHDTRSIKRLYKKYQEIVNGDFAADNNLAETEAFLLELASLQYSMEKQLQMQAANEKEMQELTQERLKKEREIDLAKLEIEHQKLELLKAEELKRQNQEYDLIAKQIVKLSSRKKTQNQMEAIKDEIEKLNEELVSVEKKIDVRKKQFYSLISHIHEIQSLVMDEQTDTLYVAADDGDDGDQVDEEGEINEEER